MRIYHSPAALLLLTGGTLGLTFPLGKLASEAAVSPIVWSWVISAGAGVCLLLLQIASGKTVSLKSNYLKFYVISAIFSIVVPNLLIFNVIPKLGSGFTGILFTLSPIITLTLSSLVNVQRPQFLGLLGIAVGFIGAVVVTLTRGEVGQPASVFWIFLGLCIPLSLASGNIYRTLAWPKGAGAFELSIGSNLTSALMLLCIMFAYSDLSDLYQLMSVKEIALAQVIGAAVMFSVFFRLQQVGGPTYLSQIGYVAAGVALISGTVFLGERYSLITWLGAVVIVVGIALSIVGQRTHPGPS